MSDQQQQQPTMNAGPQQPPLQFHFHFCYFIPTTTTAFSSQSNHDQQQERPQYQQPGNYMTNEMFNQFLAQMFQAHMNTTVGHNNNQQNQVKATKKSILSQLPVYSCDTSDSYQSQFGDCTCECSICLSDSEQDEKLMKLPCTHTFHKDCVLPWLQNHHSCPVCRFELPIEVVQPSHNNKLLNDHMDDEENRGVKQRMMEQYGPESLQLMEIGSDIQRSYSELQQWEKEKKQAESTMDESSSSEESVTSPALVCGIPISEKLVDARCGRSFTVFRTESNKFYGCGENGHGGLGLPLMDKQLIVSEIPLPMGTVLDFSCGANYTVFTTKEGGIYACGGRKWGFSSYSPQARDGELIEVCLPETSYDPTHSELRVACAQNGYHTLLYSVMKPNSTMSYKLFTAQQNGRLCDVTVIW